MSVIYRPLAGRAERTMLLSRVWTLRDCRDVEALARSCVLVAARRWNLRPALSQAEFEDTLRHLLGEVVRLERDFDPDLVRSRGYVLTRAADAGPGDGHFTGYLAGRLPFRAIDYWRHLWGRNAQRRSLGFDPDPVDREDDEGEDGVVRGDPLAQLVGPSLGDHLDDRFADLRRVVEQRRRAVLREARLLGFRPDDGAPGGARPGAGGVTEAAGDAVAA